MLLVAPADDFVGPDEEHPGEKASVVFETGLEGVLFVDLELLLWLLLLHRKNLLNLTQITSPHLTPLPEITLQTTTDHRTTKSSTVQPGSALSGPKPSSPLLL